MSPDVPTFSIALGDWSSLGVQALAIRVAVFVDEQGVPLALELDEADPVSLHALACVGGEAVATGRLLPDGRVGRMAVLAAWRGKGVGAAILAALVREAGVRGMAQLVLHSQTHATGFYARFGFEPVGDVYEEAGLPHQTMIRRCADLRPAASARSAG